MEADTKAAPPAPVKKTAPPDSAPPVKDAAAEDDAQDDAQDDSGRNWLLIDAAGLVVGRLASLIAVRLRGKHKPCWAPHSDCGDHVVVINAEKVVFTGRKLTDKIYYRHTGYPGGIKETTPERILSGKHPGRVLENAVRRMMPDGTLARQQLRHLKVYAGPDHPHKAQSPEVFDVAALHVMNTRK